MRLRAMSIALDYKTHNYKMSIEDALYPLLNLYKKSPAPVKFLLGNLYSKLPKRSKYGSFYFSYIQRIKNYSREEEQKLLAQQIKIATDKIPYYRDKKYTQVLDFPIVRKEVIQNNFKKFVNPFSKKKMLANTGGSSGNPFEFYIEKGISRPKEKAHFDWYWGMFGYQPGDKVLVIRGESLQNGKLSEYQPIENNLALSCYVLDATNIDQIIKLVNKFKPKFIHAYPSALKIFINLIEGSGRALKIDVKAVFLGSESLYNSDRVQISTYFNAKIAHWYGHSERLVHAGNCPFTEDLHVFPFYGHVALVDDKGKEIIEPQKQGRIIATGFDNTVMPFIRYDTGDEAEYSNKLECACGFKGRSFKSIHGRKQDYIVLKDLEKVSLTAFIFGQHFKEFSVINEIQLEQHLPGELVIRIVLKENHTTLSDSFIQKLEKSVNNKINILLQVVTQIPKTKRGKHVFLIQHLNLENPS